MPTPQDIKKWYDAALAQTAAESYLDGIDFSSIDPQELTKLKARLENGNNHYLDTVGFPNLTSSPEEGKGGTRMTLVQQDEFLAKYEIIDHVANQSSGFSATILRNKSTNGYSLSFRSTESRDAASGGDAERDSVQGADGEIAFGGLAFGQIASMENYFASLMEGSRIGVDAQGRPVLKTPDGENQSVSSDQLQKLQGFINYINQAGNKIDVTGYSLGGQLANMFSVLHGDKVNGLYLYNAAGVGGIREDFAGNPRTTYQELLSEYNFYMRPENRDAAYEQARDWARELAGELTTMPASPQWVSFVTRASNPAFLPAELRRAFITLKGRRSPEFQPLGVNSPDKVIERLIGISRQQDADPSFSGLKASGILYLSALNFLVSQFLFGSLDSNLTIAIGRRNGNGDPGIYASLRERGLLNPDITVTQIAGQTARGASPIANFDQMKSADDWEVAADSAIRAVGDSDLISVYIENQPTFGGFIFGDSNKNDFATTHSLTLVVDSLALMSTFQALDSSATTGSMGAVFQASSNLRKELIALPGGDGLAEHDTLEHALDALGRLLFRRLISNGIDWSKDTASANGVSSYGDLQYREAFYQRLKAVQDEIQAKGYAGTLSIASVNIDKLITNANNHDEIGIATRYALKELNPFIVTGGDIYAIHNRNQELDLYDASTGLGSITERYIQDRVDFLSQLLALNQDDKSYGLSPDSASFLYEDATTGKQVLLLKDSLTKIFKSPDDPNSFQQVGEMRAAVERGLTSGFDQSRRIAFGTDGSAFLDPKTIEGGADTLQGGTLEDHLYGGRGNDKLIGDGGNDYLEGGIDDDVLSAGAGTDTLVGGAGNDVLRGGNGDDIYIIGFKAGHDSIIDFGGPLGGIFRSQDQGDGKGHIEWTEQDLSGEKTLVDPNNPKLFMDGNEYRYFFLGAKDSRGKLTITRNDDITSSVTVDNFKSGELGITLDFQAPPVKTILNGTAGGDNGNDPASPIYNTAPQQEIRAGAGPDRLVARYDQVALFGGAGEDFAIQGDGDQYLYGEEGNDILIASGGNDELYGGTENDALQGGADDDYLSGDAGSDVLAGGAGSDVVTGGDGADFLFGGATYAAAGSGGTAVGELDAEGQGWKVSHATDANGAHTYFFSGFGGGAQVADDGADMLDGGAGDDVLYAGAGDDLLLGDVGADTLVGQEDSDTLFGGDGNDVLFGDTTTYDVSNGFYSDPQSDGSDYLDGEGGGDLLYGQGGADTLFGGDGDDEISGDHDQLAQQFHGNDYLDGEAGDDKLFGDGGDDTLFGGDGKDELSGDSNLLDAQYHGEDYLDGGAGNDVMLGQGGSDTLFGGDGDDLMAGDGDLIPVAYQGDDYIDGEAGNDVLQGLAGNDTLVGGSGSDRLEGGNDNDRLDGGTDNDFLAGGTGDDTYLFNAGDGNDTLEEEGGVDRIIFGNGISASSIIAFVPEANPQYLGVQYTATDTIAVKNGLTGNIESVEYADGSLEAWAQFLGHALTTPQNLFGTTGDDNLTGGKADDTLTGNGGNDTYSGGQGNDVLIGGVGNDTYLFNLGDGVDHIQDIATGDAGNTLVFGDGVTFDSITLDVGSLLLHVSDQDDAIHLETFDPQDVYGTHSIEFFSFSDGTTFTYSELLARGFDLVGTSNNDLIFGTNTLDRLVGDAGDDRLIGLTGDDAFDGGAGSDVLEGGPGSDSYFLSAGKDVVVDLDSGAGETDTLALNGAPADYRFQRDANNIIVIVLADPTSTITLGNALQSRYRIENVAFGDGVIWDYDQTIANSTLAAPAGGVTTLYGAYGDDVVAGTTGADSLSGREGNDTLSGGGGNDVIDGNEGDDVIAGGAGNDNLRDSGGGNERYLFQAGDGVDTLIDLGGSDRIEFGGAITAGGMSSTYFTDASGSYLRIGYNGSDAVLIKDGLTGSVESVVTGEGQSYDLRDFLNATMTTGVSVTLPSTWNTIYTGLGNDTLNASLNAGTSFYAGQGNDFLIGSAAGNDTYYFFKGDGRDFVSNSTTSDNTLVFGPGIAVADLRLSASNGTFVEIDYAPGDQITLASGTNGGVRNFRFDDGTALNLAQFLALLPTVVTGTNGNDTLNGTAGSDQLDGLDGTDVLNGFGGNDLLNGGNDSDQMFGGTGNDRLDGGGGTDVMSGGPGDDYYLVGAAGDTVVENANEGYDFIESAVSFTLGANIEDLWLTGGAATGTGNDLANRIIANVIASNTLLGLGGNDTLLGASFNDTLDGGGDDDRLEGGDGNDILRGGDGADVLNAGAGSDTLDGGPGIDVLRGGTGNDTYVVDSPVDQSVEQSGEGTDIVQSSVDYTLGQNLENLTLTGTAITGMGNELNNIIIGNISANVLYGGDGNDTITGNDGADQLHGDAGDDTLTGDDGDDQLYGDAGSDTLRGGNGADVLAGGAGDNDILDGGAGNDTYVFKVGDGLDRIFDSDATPGNIDTLEIETLRSEIRVSRDNAHLYLTIIASGDKAQLSNYYSGGDNARVEKIKFRDGTIVDSASLTIDPIDGTESNDNLDGTNFDDVINALGGDDTVNAFSGNDTVNGGAGNDTLSGLNGNDRLSGGTGADVLLGGPDSDTYIFNLGDGQDTISDQFYNSEFFTGREDILKFGAGISAQNIRVSSNDGKSIILTVGSSGDQVTLLPTQQFTSGTWVTPVTALHLGDSFYMSTAAVSANKLYGTSGDDTLKGVASSNIINQTINGLAGNDTLSGADGSDWLYGGDGNDIIEGGLGDDRLYGENGNDALSASVGNNLLDGGAGDDTLLAYDGDDVLDGGAGNDQLRGTAGNDTYRFGAGDGQDNLDETYLNDIHNTAVDTLAFKSGIAPGDVAAARIGDNLVISIKNTTDQVSIVDYFSGSDGSTINPNHTIEQVTFSNGTTWNMTQVEALANPSNINHAPILASEVADQVATEDTVFSFIVPTNAFTDVDAGDTLSYSATRASGTSLPAWLAFDPATRTFSGTPANADVGTVSIKVTATDNGGLQAADTFDVAVANTNDAPTLAHAIANQAATEDAMFSFTVPANSFADVDVGDTFAYSATQADGSALPPWMTFNAGARTFSGIPLNADVGLAILKLTASDAAGANITGTFSVVVANTNDAPVANADAVSVLENATTENLLPTFLANDADVDMGDTRSITAVNTTGTAGVVAFSAGTQTLTYAASGVALDGLRAGITATDTFSYTITDAVGATATATATVTVTGVNDAPVLANAIADQAATQNTAFSFTALLNTFADVDLGDSLTYAATLANGAALPDWLTFNAATRTFSGTPGAANVGTFALKLTATDSGNLPATDDFTLTVNHSNAAPILAEPISDQFATEDQSFSFVLPSGAFADPDPGDTLSYSASLANGAALPGWLSFDGVTRTFTGTPLNNNVGTLSAKVVAADSADASASGTFDLVVINTNDAPVAVADSVAVVENATSADLVATLLANDTDVDVGDTRSIMAVNTTGTLGAVAFNAGTQTLTYVANGAAFDALRAGATATDAFSYTITDAAGASSTATATVTITGVNDTPIANADAISVLEHAITANLVSSLLVNDTDVDIGDTRIITAVNTTGTVGVIAFNAGTQTLTYAANGATLDALRAGVAVIDRFSYTITDTAGATATATATVTVTGVNDAPTLANAIADQTASQNTAFSFTVSLNTFADVDLGDSLTYIATLANGAALPGWLTFNAATRTFSGTPGAADAGAFALRLTATDSGNLSAIEGFNLTVAGGSSGLTLIGTPSNDVLTGGTGDDLIDGRAASDRLIGNNGNDVFRYFADGTWTGGFIAYNAGSPGNTGTGRTAAIAGKNRSYDVFEGGLGTDVLLGTSGDDALFLDDSYSAFPGATRVARISAIERIEGGAGSDVIDLTSDVYAYGNVTLDGGDGNDVLWASSGNDALLGGTGNDELSGGAGNDTLDGGTGADTMDGGAGDDIYLVDNAGDAVFEGANAGADIVQSSIGYTLGGNVENLTLTGTDAINGTGNALNNVITGNSAANALNGGTGADTLVGGDGDDVYIIDNAADMVTENANAGFDTINTSVTRTLSDNVEKLALTGSAAINGTGNAADNYLVGNTAINTLAGGDGNDLINGGAGGDTLMGGAGNDVLEGMDGNDALSDTGGNNLFNGGAGNDTMTGSSGNELFAGGAGNDIINAAGGADIVAFMRGDGQDTVNASAGADNAVSLGGGIRYADLALSKSGNNLVFNVGANEKLTLANWYASPANHSVSMLQMIVEASADFDAASSDPLRNHKIASFDFLGIVDRFDEAGAPSNWSVMNTLLDRHLASSDNETLGGDLDYRYGLNGLAGVALTSAQGVLANAQFGAAPQTLQPLSGLQDGLVKLS